MLDCPHCEKPIPEPPEAWAWLPPWQCSHCAGLYGVSFGCGNAFRIPPGIDPSWPLFTWKEAKNFGYYAGARYYVYALCYPSGLPFYVGRGQRARVCQHVDEAWTLPRDRWTEKHLIILQLSDRNESEWYHFLALVETQEAAASIEQRYIREWGLRSRSGLLVNRVRPARYPPIDQLPKAPRILDISEQHKGPRRVHHPDVLEGDYENAILFGCSVCLQECFIPRNIVAKSVQCPNCAHFFKPLNQHWKPIDPELFTV